jgi:hypothetical protein
MGDQKNTKKDVQASLDALLGVPESIDHSAAEASLRDAGVGVDDLHRQMLDRLKQEAKPYWTAQKPLPPLLEAALAQFKAATGQPTTIQGMKQKAQSQLSGILASARSTLAGRSLPEFSAAFRNAQSRGLEKDKETIVELEQELFRELQRERDGK